MYKKSIAQKVVEYSQFWHNQEKELQYLKSNLLWVPILCSLIFSLIVQRNENDAAIIVSSCIAIISLLFWCFPSIRLKTGIYFMHIPSVLLFILSVVYFILQPKADWSDFFWILLIPPAFIFCSGLHMGLYFSLAYMAGLTCMLYLFPETFIKTTMYPPPVLRLLGALIGIIGLSWLMEYSYYKSQCANHKAAMMLAECALTDPLTGLGNRRDFQIHFSFAQAQAKRKSTTVSLAMLDVDKFKKINDAYGHNVGDKVLRHTATVLAKQLRLSDKLFRWGGEEFVLLMPDTPAENTRIIAERLRRAIEQTPYMAADCIIAVTVSIGLHSTLPDADLDALIAQADKNLYAAKNQGRNRIAG